ncbi:UspA domain-containing protein [Desulfobulbus propionicus DSM 2032]|jgi:nucleotide-binding universal stress UspA family protein|uniref:UspA domain-containing protein n=1 Tax=Desulfobulbus propionicus (strain ATCC 33891 / DSM 2032 / VKM B-1956 / 1pr3) TaxID=577650 RepID=A0A7U4DPP3_DESPD|nr:universal stress protein [Desulfobulbus propionicus]ADW18262.1 UspA domain-containing protein [Desulfobulbus propionicus DSM 2032]
MDRRIVLAHDGSINADWVGRYALRMAAALPSRQLLFVHILDGSCPRGRIEAKYAAFARECAQHAIESSCLIRELEGDVLSSLLRTIPPGEQTYCLCGARIAPRGRGFLAGTVSERLLRSGLCNVMAIRVVSPGLLGCPRTLLFPLAGHPRGPRAALPFLRLLVTSVNRLHLLRVMTVNPLYFRYITAAAAKRKISVGSHYLAQAAAEIRAQIADVPLHVDRHVTLSDDWAKEILIQAGKLNAAMILLGATERSLPHRFFYGNRIEQILRATACDVGIYRTL